MLDPCWTQEFHELRTIRGPWGVAQVALLFFWPRKKQHQQRLGDQQDSPKLLTKLCNLMSQIFWASVDVMPDLNKKEIHSSWPSDPVTFAICSSYRSRYDHDCCPRVSTFKRSRHCMAVGQLEIWIFGQIRGAFGEVPRPGNGGHCHDIPMIFRWYSMIFPQQHPHSSRVLNNLNTTHMAL